MKKKRLFSIIFGVVFLCAVSFSLFSMATEISHHCEGEDCPICADIEQCTHTVDSLGLGIAVAWSLFFQKYLGKNKEARTRQHDEKITLVSLKIKLSN